MRKHTVVAAAALVGCLSSSEPRLGNWNSHLTMEVAFQAGTDAWVPGADAWVQGDEPFRVAYDTASGWLRAKVRITNLGQDTLRGNTGGTCAWYFRAYDSPEREGVPLWRQETAEHATVCYQSLLELAVAPGETFEFKPWYVGDLAELRALASGRPLYLAAALRFDIGPDEYSYTQESGAGSITF